MTCEHCSTLAKANREMADRTIAAERKVEALLSAVKLRDTRGIELDLRLRISFKQGLGEDYSKERLALELIEGSR